MMIGNVTERARLFPTQMLKSGKQRRIVLAFLLSCRAGVVWQIRYL